MKKCDLNDFEKFYFLRCDPKNLTWTGHSEKPDKIKLQIWFEDQLKRLDRVIFIALNKENQEEVVGYLYLDNVGHTKEFTETGHGVHSDFGGHGIGTQIIKFAVEASKTIFPHVNKIQGWIATENFGSIKNVLKNGYVKTQDKKLHYTESFKKKIEMLRFERSL